MHALSSWLIFCAKPRKEITGPNEDHKGDIRLLGAWNSDDNIRRRSALQIFGDGFRRFWLQILALDMVFPISVSEYRTCRNEFLRICWIGYYWNVEMVSDSF
ncbi:hypothetical protein RIR_jg34700.t1 [Rhizophagus irregularis DAOM 181602=DAOM 197198]|nr:hypothetical protein RIR_jg34700.t1 [Rhizophagus irregularis DAOM 181602=DAOM 197198]